MTYHNNYTRFVNKEMLKVVVNSGKEYLKKNLGYYYNENDINDVIQPFIGA